MKTTEYSTISEKRQKSAACFIKDLSDIESLSLVLDSLNATSRTLILEGNEAYGNSKEQTAILEQLHYLSNITDALIYLSTNNPLKTED